MTPIEIAPEQLQPLLPPRPVDGHKGTFGHFFAIAGSRGFTGAAKLVAEAAGRSGVGLVTVGVPESLAHVVAAGLTEAMTMVLPATPDETISVDAVKPALAFAEGKTAVAIGPGLSQHSETVRFVRDFVRRCPVPLVVDADALNALSEDPDSLGNAASRGVLTPHPGEMARLCGKSNEDVQADREGTARDVAMRYGFTVVLKGHRTVVAGPDGDVHVNPTGNSGMATGGSGDVLTGLIGGLMAQAMEPLPAALVGVYLHGVAGDLAAQEKTQHGMIASDVIDLLPAAWRALDRSA